MAAQAGGIDPRCSQGAGRQDVGAVDEDDEGAGESRLAPPDDLEGHTQMRSHLGAYNGGRQGPVDGTGQQRLAQGVVITADDDVDGATDGSSQGISQGTDRRHLRCRRRRRRQREAQHRSSRRVGATALQQAGDGSALFAGQ
jgi:hypothetical protein